MAMFKAFKPSGMEKIARSMGYQGNMQGFQDYLANNPAQQQQMNMYTNAAQTMAKGGMARKKFAVGGTVTNPAGTQAATPTVTGPSYTTTPNPYLQTTPTPNQAYTAVAPQAGNMFAYKPDGTRVEVPTGYNFGPTQTPKNIGEFSVEQMYTPGVPVGGTTIAAQTQTDQSQDIAAGTGALTGTVATPTAMALTAQAAQPAQTQANVMQAAQAAPGVDSAMNATQAAQANPQDPRAQITAAQQTTSSVGNLTAAQGNASLINNPVQRQIQQGELISGVANAQTASQFTEQIQAAQATPSQQATVQGQLNNLMQQFQGGATPPWASGAMLNVSSQLWLLVD
jgi:hypothetical protein